MITLGANGDDGCGVIPFHNHPNCFEVMTTVSGYGAYGQIRPDGTTQVYAFYWQSATCSTDYHRMLF